MKSITRYIKHADVQDSEKERAKNIKLLEECLPWVTGCTPEGNAQAIFKRIRKVIRSLKAFDSTNNDDLVGVLNTVLRSQGLRVTKKPVPRVKKRKIHETQNV